MAKKPEIGKGYSGKNPPKNQSRVVKKVIIIYQFIKEKENPIVFTTKRLTKAISEILTLCEKHEIVDTVRIDLLKNVNETFKRNEDFYEYTNDFFQVCIYNEDIWN